MDLAGRKRHAEAVGRRDALGMVMAVTDRGAAAAADPMKALGIVGEQLPGPGGTR